MARSANLMLTQKALEIAHREFVELRDVEDESIHFCMFIKLHATAVMESHHLGGVLYGVRVQI